VLCMDAKNVVLLLNDSRTWGNLERRRDPEDRRRHRVTSPTPVGRRFQRAAHVQESIGTMSSRPSTPTSARRCGGCSAGRAGAEPAPGDAAGAALAPAGASAGRS